MTCNTCQNTGLSIRSSSIKPHSIIAKYCTCKTGQALEKINPLNLNNLTLSNRKVEYISKRNSKITPYLYLLKSGVLYQCPKGEQNHDQAT